MLQRWRGFGQWTTAAWTGLLGPLVGHTGRSRRWIGASNMHMATTDKLNQASHIYIYLYHYLWLGRPVACREIPSRRTHPPCPVLFIPHIFIQYPLSSTAGAAGDRDRTSNKIRLRRERGGAQAGDPPRSWRQPARTNTPTTSTTSTSTSTKYTPNSRDFRGGPFQHRIFPDSVIRGCRAVNWRIIPHLCHVTEYKTSMTVPS
jgi:hypothetical protein